MEMEEEWLKEVASSMMEYKEPTVIKETRRMVEEVMDMNTNIYQGRWTIWSDWRQS